jgi:hypothetical protein
MGEMVCYLKRVYEVSVCLTYSRTLGFTIAIGKKVATAVAERPLSLERPHSMCPDVHPFDT